MHRIDTLEFRSQRAKEDSILLLYSTLTKQHTYSLLALYPCATQSDGEFGYNLIYFTKLKKELFLVENMEQKLISIFQIFKA